MSDNRRGFGDPDARLGRGKRGFYLGYRSLFLVDIEGFLLSHVETPTNVNEALLLGPLLDNLLGEDSGFNSSKVFYALEDRR